MSGNNDKARSPSSAALHDEAAADGSAPVVANRGRFFSSDLDSVSESERGSPVVIRGQATDDAGTDDPLRSPSLRRVSCESGAAGTGAGGGAGAGDGAGEGGEGDGAGEGAGSGAPGTKTEEAAAAATPPRTRSVRSGSGGVDDAKAWLRTLVRCMHMLLRDVARCYVRVCRR